MSGITLWPFILLGEGFDRCRALECHERVARQSGQAWAVLVYMRVLHFAAVTCCAHGCSEVTINHEKIHIAQANELLVLGMYILWLFEFVM